MDEDRELKKVIYRFILRLCSIDGWVSKQAEYYLIEIGKPAVPALIETLNYNKEWKVRSHAAEALGKIKDALAVPVLVKALNDGRKEVQDNAKRALIEIGPPAVPLLIEALRIDSCHIRWNVVYALGAIRDASAVPSLTEALNDPDALVQDEATVALGKIGAVHALINALHHENVHVRRNAAMALADTKDPRAVRALVDTLKEEDARLFAARALAKVGFDNITLNDKILCLLILDKTGDIQLMGNAVFPALFKAMTDKDSKIRKNSAWVLGLFGEPALSAFNEAYINGNIQYELAEIFYKTLNNKLKSKKFEKGCTALPMKGSIDSNDNEMKQMLFKKLDLRHKTRDTRPYNGNRKPETLKRCMVVGK